MLLVPYTVFGVHEMTPVKHGTLLQFADDTAPRTDCSYSYMLCMVGIVSDVHQQISEDLLSVSNWIVSSKMRLDVIISS